YAADDPQNGNSSGHNKVVVRGDDNQIVLGNNNVVGRGDVDSSGHGGAVEEDDQATVPRQPYATVHDNVTSLTERSEPRTSGREIAQIGPRTNVPVSCFVTGENIHGDTTWYRVRAEGEFREGYISAYYTTLHGSVSRCP